MSSSFDKEVESFVELKQIAIDSLPVATEGHGIGKSFKTGFADVGRLDDYVSLSDQQQEKRIIQHVRAGDIVLGRVTDVSEYGLELECLEIDCKTSSNLTFTCDDSLFWDEVRVTCPVAELPRDDDKEHPTDGFEVGDMLQAVIVCCSDPTWTISLRLHRLKHEHRSTYELGFLSDSRIEDLWQSVRRARLVLSSRHRSVTSSGDAFVASISSQMNFKNPFCVDNLMEVLHVPAQDAPCTLLKKLGSSLSSFSSDQLYPGLRLARISKIAGDLVVEAVDLMKNGRTKDALARLNQALGVDSTNCDALVARGALYANSGDLSKGIEDLHLAMTEHPSNTNAKKFWIQTKITLGKQLERKLKLRQAMGHVTDVLAICPDDAAALELHKQLEPHLTRMADEARQRNKASRARPRKRVPANPGDIQFSSFTRQRSRSRSSSVSSGQSPSHVRHCKEYADSRSNKAEGESRHRERKRRHSASDSDSDSHVRHKKQKKSKPSHGKHRKEKKKKKKKKSKSKREKFEHWVEAPSPTQD